MNDIFAKLAVPFNPIDLEWRAGASNSDKSKALALAYLTSRAVMDRLDEVVGPENWRDEFKPGPDGGLICGLSLRVDGEWITKWDGAENTQFEEVKGGLSGAFKRAAVKWGIGRYLYRLPNTWVPCEVHGKNISSSVIPDLPDWALPVSDVGSGSTTPKKKNAEKEQQILHELGFDDPSASPEAETVKEEPKNGKNGSSRTIFWNSEVVQAILKAGLAENAPKAVTLLNSSNLSRNVSPQEAVSWVMTTQAA